MTTLHCGTFILLNRNIYRINAFIKKRPKVIAALTCISATTRDDLHAEICLSDNQFTTLKYCDVCKLYFGLEAQHIDHVDDSFNSSVPKNEALCRSINLASSHSALSNKLFFYYKNSFFSTPPTISDFLYEADNTLVNSFSESKVNNKTSPIHSPSVLREEKVVSVIKDEYLLTTLNKEDKEIKIFIKENAYILRFKIKDRVFEDVIHSLSSRDTALMAAKISIKMKLKEGYSVSE